MTAIVGTAALAITAGGLVAAAVTLGATRRPMLALKVLLDFLLAAGLLRLTGRPDWPVLAGAAGVIVLRRIVGFGLRAGMAGPLRRSAGSHLVPGRRRP